MLSDNFGMYANAVMWSAFIVWAIVKTVRHNRLMKVLAVKGRASSFWRKYVALKALNGGYHA